jgi:nicotinamide riboside transporter PnuC
MYPWHNNGKKDYYEKVWDENMKEKMWRWMIHSRVTVGTLPIRNI